MTATWGADDVVVVGAGIGGIACARALGAAGVGVRVLERARRVGGRMASPPVHDRPVDLGAAYFTVSDDGFRAVVDDWAARGLARPWTDTMAVRAEDGGWSTKSGPDRWAAPGGLRALVADLAEDVPVTTGHTVDAVTSGPTGPAVDGSPAAAVVLAMPDPQAARLLDPALPAAAVVAGPAWDPVIAVALGYPQRLWDPLPAAFVNGHPDVALIADDGSRRGDDAPVLVAHTTSARARRHLDDPEGAIGPVVDAVTELLALDRRPDWTHAHRWSFAAPADTHDTGGAGDGAGDGDGDGPFHLDDTGIGVCGDSWAASKVQTAWRSGTLLGRALAARHRR